MDSQLEFTGVKNLHSRERPGGGGWAASSGRVVSRGGGRGISMDRGGKTKAQERSAQSRVSGCPIVTPLLMNL